MKQVKVTEFINELILEIKEKREDENNLITSKQGIVHEAIQALHKKECKK